MNRNDEPTIECKSALKCLGRIEAIEALLDFDLPSLVLFADSVADERQYLTRLGEQTSDEE